MKLWISLGHTFGHALAKSNDSSAWRRSHMFRTYCDILPQLSLYRTVYQNISNIFFHLFGISDMNTLKSSDLADQNQRPRATMNSCDAWGVLLSFTRPNRPETMHAKLQPQNWQRIHTDTYPVWKIVQRVCLMSTMVLSYLSRVGCWVLKGGFKMFQVWTWIAGIYQNYSSATLTLLATIQESLEFGKL